MNKDENQKTAQTSGTPSQVSGNGQQQEDNLDLVKILSHTSDSGNASDDSSMNFGNSKV